MHKLTKDFSSKYNWELPAICRRNNNFLISTTTFCMNSRGPNLDPSLKMLPSGQLLNREHNISKLRSRKLLLLSSLLRTTRIFVLLTSGNLKIEKLYLFQDPSSVPPANSSSKFLKPAWLMWNVRHVATLSAENVISSTWRLKIERNMSLKNHS